MYDDVFACVKKSLKERGEMAKIGKVFMIFCRKADPQQQLHLFPGNYIFARYIASTHCLDMDLNDQKMRQFLVCFHSQAVLSFSNCAFISKMYCHFQNVLSFSKCTFILKTCFYFQNVSLENQDFGNAHQFLIVDQGIHYRDHYLLQF